MKKLKRRNPARKKFLITSVILLFIIIVVGHIVAEVHNIPRHTGLYPSIVILISMIPFTNIAFIGTKYAHEKGAFILKYILYFIIILFDLCSIVAVLINIIHIM